MFSIRPLTSAKHSQYAFPVFVAVLGIISAALTLAFPDESRVALSSTFSDKAANQAPPSSPDRPASPLTYAYAVGSEAWRSPYPLQPLNSVRRDFLTLRPGLASADVTLQFFQADVFMDEFHRRVEQHVSDCSTGEHGCTEALRSEAYIALDRGTRNVFTSLNEGEVIEIETDESLIVPVIKLKVRDPLTGQSTEIGSFGFDVPRSSLRIDSDLVEAADPDFPPSHYAYLRTEDCSRNPNCSATPTPTPTPGPTSGPVPHPQTCRKPRVTVFAVPGGGNASGQQSDIRFWHEATVGNPALRDVDIDFQPLPYNRSNRVAQTAKEFSTKIAAHMRPQPPDQKFVLVSLCQGAVTTWAMIRLELPDFPSDRYAGFLSFEPPLAGGWGTSDRPFLQFWAWFDFLNVTYGVWPSAEDLLAGSALLKTMSKVLLPGERRYLRLDGDRNYVPFKIPGRRVRPPTFDHVPWLDRSYVHNRAAIVRLKEMASELVHSAVGNTPSCPQPDPQPTIEPCGPFCGGEPNQDPDPSPTPTATPTPTPTPTATPITAENACCIATMNLQGAPSFDCKPKIDNFCCQCEAHWSPECQTKCGMPPPPTLPPGEIAPQRSASFHADLSCEELQGQGGCEASSCIGDGLGPPAIFGSCDECISLLPNPYYTYCTVPDSYGLTCCGYSQ